MPIVWNPQEITAVYIRPGSDLFLSGHIGCGNSGAGNRHIPRPHHAVNASSHLRRRSSLVNSLSPQRVGTTRRDLKQEEELQDKFRARPALDIHNANTGNPHGVVLKFDPDSDHTARRLR
jgi:hypothetical protein